MDWYQIIFELIDMRSFSNLWYWIVLGVEWSMASHWVMGVPYDMVVRARREGGEAVEDLVALVRINVNRMLYIERRGGLWLAAAASFLLSVLALLSFWYWVEFAQALTFLLVPLMILGLLSLRTAGKIMSVEHDADALYRRLFRHRLMVQLLGMVSIFVTALFGMYQNIQLGLVP